MNKQQLLILINKEIDNDININEKKLLDQELNQNSDSRKLYDELKQLSLLITKDAGTRTPEVNIADDVIQKIDTGKYISKKQALLPAVFGSKRFIISYSLGIVTGILLLLIAFSAGVINNGTTGLTGTIGEAETYGKLKTAGEIYFNHDNIKGSIKSQSNDVLAIITVDINTSERITIGLNYEDTMLKVYSIKPLSVNSQSNFSSSGRLVLFNNSGENRYMVLFRNNSDNIRHGFIKIKLSSVSGESGEYLLSLNN